MDGHERCDAAIARLEARIAEMESQPLPAPIRSSEPETRVDRRGALRLLGYGAAGAAALSLTGVVRPTAAGAANGQPLIMGANNGATLRTLLLSDVADDAALAVKNFGSTSPGTAVALFADSNDQGVLAYGRVGVAANGDEIGVHAQCTNSTAQAALVAESTQVGSPVPAIRATHTGGQGAGSCVLAEIGSPSIIPRVAAVHAAVNNVQLHGVIGSNFSGTGVYGHKGNGSGLTTPCGVVGDSATGPAVGGFASSGIGVFGTSDSGPGVKAASVNGRGLVASGKTAQMRLLPNAASTHPASGLPGDLFVDSANRLWFCKSGTTWVQLA
jgi:hypothetical protein